MIGGGRGGGGGRALSIFRIASSSSLRGDFGHRLIAGKNSIADLKHHARVTARLASPRLARPLQVVEECLEPAVQRHISEHGRHHGRQDSQRSQPAQARL